MQIIAGLLLIPLVCLSALLFLTFVFVHGLQLILAFLAFVLSFAGGETGHEPVISSALVALGFLLRELLIVCTLLILSSVPLAIPYYFFHQGKFGIAIGISLVLIAMSLPFLPGLMASASHLGGIPSGADPATYRVLSAPGMDTLYPYATDTHSVFCGGEKVEGADPTTFSLVPPVFAKDATHVYYHCAQVAGADPATFIPLGRNGYGKDDHAVYFANTVLPGADPATFQTIDRTNGAHVDAQDKYHQYWYGQIVQ